MTVRLLTDDEKIQLSEEAAVLTTTELSKKWKVSRSTVTRILNELGTYAYGSDKYWEAQDTKASLFEDALVCDPIPLPHQRVNDAHKTIEPKCYADWQKLAQPYQPEPEGFFSKLLERFVRSLLFSQHYSP